MRLWPSTLTRYLVASYARAAIATLLGVVAVVLVVDFADRSYSFRGEGWVANVIRLYANLALDLAYQVAPSALLLAAGITVSGLRRTGEYAAILSLGGTPRRVIAAILISCAVAGAGLVALNESLVVEASRKADEIKATSFRRSSNFRAYFEPQHWFRGGDRIFNLRVPEGDGVFGDVTIYELDSDFRLRRRIDADRMAPLEDGSWELGGATVQTFADGQRLGSERHTSLRLPLPQTPQDFEVRAGKPRQMGLFDLYEQAGLRERMGLDTLEYRHELHNRLAYPFAAVPGALLAIRLAMRRDRKGHLTTALAEGIVVSLVVWSMLTIFRALGVSGNLDPALAAWLPALLLTAVGIGSQWSESRRAARPVPKALPAV